MENVMKALKKHVVIIIGLLILLGCPYAVAYSGGSMGGSDFSSFGSSDWSSSSSDFSSSYYSSSSLISDDSSSYYSSSNRKIINTNNSTSAEPSSLHPIIVLVPILIMFLIVLCSILVSQTKVTTTSVVKLQARSLQRNLNSIANKADTSKPKGFRYILQETISTLLQNHDYFVSAGSSLDAMNGVYESEIRFKELSAAERRKFDELTLVNFNNFRNQTVATEEYNGLPNEYIVITIIVAVWGIHELPAIKSVEKLKEALQKLSSISSSNIMAVEVLWTPQKENDILTERQVREDYPMLQPLSYSYINNITTPKICLE